MALADYTDEDGYADPTRLFDDVAAIGKIPGTQGRGWSDEYMHFWKDMDMPNGYVEVVLFLRTDNWDNNPDNVSSFTNLYIGVIVNVVAPEQLTKDKVQEALNDATGEVGQPYNSEISLNGDYYSRLPKDEFIPLIEGVRIDYDAGEKIDLKGDDMWSPEDLATIFATDMQWAINQAKVQYNSINQILNG